MLFFILLCLLLGLLLGGGYYAYRYAFYSPKAGREDLVCRSPEYPQKGPSSSVPPALSSL